MRVACQRRKSGVTYVTCGLALGSGCGASGHLLSDLGARRRGTGWKLSAVVLYSRIRQARASAGAAVSRLHSAEAQLNACILRLRRAEADLRAAEARYLQTRKQIVETQEAVDKAKRDCGGSECFAQRLVAMRKSGNSDYLP